MRGIPGYLADDYRVRLEDMAGELADAVRREEQLTNLLHEVLDYLDQRADCDCDQDGFVPNEEMRLMMHIEEVL
jgi:predicted transposase YbfD/YdcC